MVHMLNESYILIPAHHVPPHLFILFFFIFFIKKKIFCPAARIGATLDIFNILTLHALNNNTQYQCDMVQMFYFHRYRVLIDEIQCVVPKKMHFRTFFYQKNRAFSVIKFDDIHEYGPK